MTIENATPEIRELVARNILLSHGGYISVPGYERLTFPVEDNEGNVKEKTVYGIHFYAGRFTSIHLSFADTRAEVRDKDDLKKVVDYILEGFKPSDLDIPLEKDALNEQLTLLVRNYTFIRRYGDFNKEDLEMIASHRKALESARKAVEGHPVPLPGDTVEGLYGDSPFNQGLIDSGKGRMKPLHVCARPYVPFIFKNSSVPVSYSLSVSGGPFFSLDNEDLEYVGPDERYFCDWGHNGPCVDGAVEFRAKVNRWRIKEGVKI